MTLPERSSLSRSVWKGADDDVDVCAHFDRLRRVPFLLWFFSDSSFLLYRWSKDTMSDDVEFGEQNPCCRNAICEVRRRRVRGLMSTLALNPQTRNSTRSFLIITLRWYVKEKQCRNDFAGAIFLVTECLEGCR